MNVRRRRLLLAAVAAGACPIALAAPPDRTVRIGIAMTEFHDFTDEAIGAVLRGLREQGYIDGKNAVIVRRTARWPDGPMAKNVAELIAMKPDVIVAGCGWSMQTLLKATRSVPVVMVAASDPIGRGWVPSLARPGANITGVTGMLTDIPAKMLDHLRLVLPELNAVGIPLNLRGDFHKGILRDLESTAARLGIRIVPIDLNPLTTSALTREALRAAGVQAIMNVPDDNLFWYSVERVIEAARELKIFVATFRSDFVREGVLMSFGAEPIDLFRRTGTYVDRIANGANPAMLPIELPTRLEFAINVKEAERAGLTIPRGVFLRADKLIK